MPIGDPRGAGVNHLPAFARGGLAVALCLPALGLALAWPAGAATLQVGPDAEFKTPSAAAKAVEDGDTVEIAPGEYFDCAIWRASRLTVEGTGPGVVLTDLPCEGKASFVTRGDGITLRNLTFTRIRVPDRNGAGIRAEGRDLTVEHSRFINNQVGILAGDAMPSTITVRDCAFSDNGVADAPGGGTADLLIGRIVLLRVEHSQLLDRKGGAAIVSDAVRSELAGNRIAAGGAAGRPFVVGATGGGSLVMDDNALTLGAGAGAVAVEVAQDGDLPAGEVALRHTVLVNDTGAPAVLLRNWGDATPVLQANTLPPGDTELSSDGATLHRLKQAAHRTIAWLRATAAGLRHIAALVVHRLQAMTA